MSDLFTARRAWWSDETPVPLYRYMLAITWGEHGCHVMVVILANPSTADEFKNDPTVGRVEARARALGYGGVIILNAFAYRATDPDDMRAAAEPVGKFNDAYIRNTLKEAAIKGWPVMVGWGEIGRHQSRHLEVAALIRESGVQPLCLRISKTGQPWHPLYAANDWPLIPWPLDAAADLTKVHPKEPAR